VQALGKSAQKLHSLRLAKVATFVAASNPFVKVLEMINKTVALIDKEQTDDDTKVAWCNNEKTTNEANRDDKETDISTLETNLGNLNTVLTDTKDNIEAATSDLQMNRDSQATETESRQAANAVFQTNLANIQEAEKILTKAIGVLKKYYAWLHAHQGSHGYVLHGKTDSGGANLERLAGKSVDELKEACSGMAECVGFNTAGWLKSAVPEEEWFDWEGGDLYVKEFDQALLQQKPGEEAMEGEPETFGDEMEGQRDAGGDVIQQLEFIQEETVKEMHEAIDDERESQSTYESTMQALTQQETELTEGITSYKGLKAKTEKDIEETHEDKATTEREHKAIVDYLAKIEPDCTFYVSNLETRSQNRAAEKSALENAVSLIKGTPAFQAAVAAQTREDLGKCIPKCDEFGSDHAECLACQEGVTVFGYCAQNSAPGCSEATATSSADALALTVRK
jgi:chromosome segregation ATPase